MIDRSSYITFMFLHLYSTLVASVDINLEAGWVLGWQARGVELDRYLGI